MPLINTCNLHSLVNPQILKFPSSPSCFLGFFFFLTNWFLPNPAASKLLDMMYWWRTKHSLYFSTLPPIFCWPTLPRAKGEWCAYSLVSLFRTELSPFGCHWFIQPGQTPMWKNRDVFPEHIKGCLHSSCQVASRCNTAYYKMKQANFGILHMLTVFR